MIEDRGLERDEDARQAPSLLGVLRLSWGLAAILALAGYSFVHTLTAAQPVPRVIGGGTVANAAAVMRSQQPVYIGGKAFYPAPPVEGPLVVHLTCDEEDARIARTYDALPGGRGLVLRLDQSSDEMRNLYFGRDPKYPKDTRLITTPCMQALIDYGEFP
jgi:hypothetical protein